VTILPGGCARFHRGLAAGTFKQTEGTGLGDGDTSNAKDVSKQIENEDQITGAHQKNDVPEEPEEGAQEEGEREEGQEEGQEGIEMGQDFEGEVGDVPEEEDRGDGDEVRLGLLTVCVSHQLWAVEAAAISRAS
jgi:hypothetical protein